MSEERKRPIKQFKARIAFGPYRVGDKLQPTGMYRDTLVKRGLIEEVQDEPVPEPRVATPDANRMVPQASLFAKSGRKR